MKENEDILEKAVKAIKNQQIPPGPPQELTDATIAKLTEQSEQSEQSETVSIENRIRIIERLKSVKGITKVAAAAVLLIAASYATGRLSAPRPPDMEQLQAALEPAIRSKLLEEMDRRWQLALASSYVRLQEELSEQYRQDLSRFAVQTLAASNAVTNQLLAELVQSINTVQTQDLRRIAAVIEMIELNRLQDKTQLTDGLESLAYLTEDELQRTRQAMAQFLVNTQPDNMPLDAPENSKIPE